MRGVSLERLVSLRLLTPYRDVPMWHEPHVDQSKDARANAADAVLQLWQHAPRDGAEARYQISELVTLFLRVVKRGFAGLQSTDASPSIPDAYSGS